MFAFDNEIQYQVVFLIECAASGDRGPHTLLLTPAYRNETIGEMPWKDTWDRKKTVEIVWKNMQTDALRPSNTTTAAEENDFKRYV